jgi:hypothetical protein
MELVPVVPHKIDLVSDGGRVMSMYQSARVNPAQQFRRPRCSSCGGLMLLARVDEDRPGQDTRIFECSHCDKFETVVVTFAPAR